MNEFATLKPAIVTLTNRADFVRLSAKGARIGCETLQLQAMDRPQGSYNACGKWQKENGDQQKTAGDFIRVGFTVTKKQGNAVLRNRVKRRLRAAVRKYFPALAIAGVDYVLVGRALAAECPYETILRDLKYALKKIEQKRVNAAAPARGAAG